MVGKQKEPFGIESVRGVDVDHEVTRRSAKRGHRDLEAGRSLGVEGPLDDDDGRSAAIDDPDGRRCGGLHHVILAWRAAPLCHGSVTTPSGGFVVTVR
jgi:hypothetical protein